MILTAYVVAVLAQKSATAPVVSKKEEEAENKRKKKWKLFEKAQSKCIEKHQITLQNTLPKRKLLVDHSYRPIHICLQSLPIMMAWPRLFSFLVYDIYNLFQISENGLLISSYIKSKSISTAKKERKKEKNKRKIIILTMWIGWALVTCNCWGCEESETNCVYSTAALSLILAVCEYAKQKKPTDFWFHLFQHMHSYKMHLLLQRSMQF